MRSFSLRTFFFFTFRMLWFLWLQVWSVYLMDYLLFFSIFGWLGSFDVTLAEALVRQHNGGFTACKDHKAGSFGLVAQLHGSCAIFYQRRNWNLLAPVFQGYTFWGLEFRYRLQHTIGLGHCMLSGTIWSRYLPAKCSIRLRNEPGLTICRNNRVYQSTPGCSRSKFYYHLTSWAWISTFQGLAWAYQQYITTNSLKFTYSPACSPTFHLSLLLS